MQTPSYMPCCFRTEQRQAENKSQAEVLDEIYSGAKASLRPIHEAVMMEITKLGEFEIVPKKGYVSLRRKKQFAMLGPATNKRLELGLNVKDLPPSERLIEQPKGSMCNYVVKLTDVGQVDAELATWAKICIRKRRVRRSSSIRFIAYFKKNAGCLKLPALVLIRQYQE